MSDKKRATNVPYVEGKENVSELSLSQSFTLKLETDSYVDKYVLTMVREPNQSPVTEAPLITWEGNPEPPIALECADLSFSPGLQPGQKVKVYAIIFSPPKQFLVGKEYTLVH